MAKSLERIAPAKINLALHVTGRRADGYHLLETLVAFTRYGDLLRAEPAAEDSLSVTGRFSAGVPRDGSNLVAGARDLMREQFGAAAAGPVALTLEKNLPVASGIGGGSSDAAAAIGLLVRYWNIDAAGAETLADLALQLGADVPMCLTGRPLLARGIGEALEPVADFPTLPLVLANPGLPLATPAVFATLIKRDNPSLPPFEGGGISETVRWLRSTRNDLEQPAMDLTPQIAGVLDELRGAGAILARMSGSGATCFGIFRTGNDAWKAEKIIASRHPAWFVQATTISSAAEAVQNG